MTVAVSKVNHMVTESIWCSNHFGSSSTTTDQELLTQLCLLKQNPVHCSFLFIVGL